MLKKMKVMEMILAGLNSAKGRILGWTHRYADRSCRCISWPRFFDKHGDDIFVKAEEMEGLYWTQFLF